MTMMTPVPTGAPLRSGVSPTHNTPDDLTVLNLSKTFGDTTILDGINLTIAKGESVAIVGANGCGKSTLLRCCIKLIEPSAGQLSLFGQDITSLKGKQLRRVRSRIGTVFQKHQLVPNLCALTNVVHGELAHHITPRRYLQCLAPTEIRQQAMTCLERVNLSHLARRKTKYLSGGESQRVAIARTLMQRPAMVFADEPAASLDPRVGLSIMELFIELIRNQGISLVFVSHDLDHALRFADRIVGIKQGRVFIDQPSKLLSPADLSPLYQS